MEKAKQDWRTKKTRGKIRAGAVCGGRLEALTQEHKQADRGREREKSGNSGAKNSDETIFDAALEEKSDGRTDVNTLHFRRKGSE